MEDRPGVQRVVFDAPSRWLGPLASRRSRARRSWRRSWVRARASALTVKEPLFVTKVAVVISGGPFGSGAWVRASPKPTRGPGTSHRETRTRGRRIVVRRAARRTRHAWSARSRARSCMSCDWRSRNIGHPSSRSPVRPDRSATAREPHRRVCRTSAIRHAPPRRGPRDAPIRDARGRPGCRRRPA